MEERADKKRFTRINTGTIEEGKAQMVFAIIYATDGKPYEKYMGVDEKDRNTEIPVVLMQMRWDGFVGFPGGKVDPGEDLITAVRRELYEEIGCFPPAENLIPFTTFSSEKSNIHSYVYEVSMEHMLMIQRTSMDCQHFMAENCGCILPHIAKYEGNRGINEFLNNNFIATAKMELETFIEEIIKLEV